MNVMWTWSQAEDDEVLSFAPSGPSLRSPPVPEPCGTETSPLAASWWNIAADPKYKSRKSKRPQQQDTPRWLHSKLQQWRPPFQEHPHASPSQIAVTQDLVWYFITLPSSLLTFLLLWRKTAISFRLRWTLKVAVAVAQREVKPTREVNLNNQKISPANGKLKAGPGASADRSGGFLLLGNRPLKKEGFRNIKSFENHAPKYRSICPLFSWGNFHVNLTLGQPLPLPMLLPFTSSVTNFSFFSPFVLGTGSAGVTFLVFTILRLSDSATLKQSEWILAIGQH